MGGGHRKDSSPRLGYLLISVFYRSKPTIICSVFRTTWNGHPCWCHLGIEGGTPDSVMRSTIQSCHSTLLYNMQATVNMELRNMEFTHGN